MLSLVFLSLSSSQIQDTLSHCQTSRTDEICPKGTLQIPFRPHPSFGNRLTDQHLSVQKPPCLELRRQAAPQLWHSNIKDALDQKDCNRGGFFDCELHKAPQRVDRGECGLRNPERTTEAQHWPLLTRHLIYMDCSLATFLCSFCFKKERINQPAQTCYSVKQQAFMSWKKINTIFSL